ncbi:hypothetical protein BH23BAC4_BH23BAC4_09040 [soil metagenome]
MPYDYEIFPAYNLALVTATGRIAGKDIIETIHRMDQDERWEQGMHQICDFLEVKGVAVSLPEMHQIVSLEEHHLEDTQDGKLALLADSFDMRAICKLFSLMSRFRGPEAKVFRNRKEAIAWLDLPGDQTQKAVLDTLLAGSGLLNDRSMAFADESVAT